ncbi:hypothetical protein [Clostridium massiliamazoniense]|uniref:hypothetical protein n=1 Tax=Clostridium massiliamazoniense TaxID=1347366 RepID=UPI0006D83771|nr:hypothetical protein [Clostridium massiliamazoniense]
MKKKDNECKQCEILEAELKIEKLKFGLWDRELSKRNEETDKWQEIIKKQDEEIELLKGMIKVMNKALEMASETTKKQIETMKKNTKEEF